MRKIVFCFAIAATLASCHVFKAYRFRNFELKDLKKLDAVSLPPSAAPFAFAYDTLSYEALKKTLDDNLRYSQTYAFLVIRNDTVLYERYFGSVSDSTQLPSFSVAKSVTSTLLGMARDEGRIPNLHEPITTFLPELRSSDPRFDRVTLQQVLDMRSGVKSSENYGNPFSDVLKMGFAGNVSKQALNAKLEKEPGSFDYKSVNTQILATVVSRTTGKSMHNYAIEKLWKPLGMEHTATWNVDKQQTPRAFCCLNATARDYAKFGRLFLNEGQWQGRQLLSKEWVNRSVNLDTLKAYDGYKNQWWATPTRKYFSTREEAEAFAKTKHNAAVRTVRTPDGAGQRLLVEYYEAYHAEGILGQYVYIHPAKKLIIVRLGHNWSHPNFYAERFIYNLGEEL